MAHLLFPSGRQAPPSSGQVGNSLEQRDDSASEDPVLGARAGQEADAAVDPLRLGIAGVAARADQTGRPAQPARRMERGQTDRTRKPAATVLGTATDRLDEDDAGVV